MNPVYIQTWNKTLALHNQNRLTANKIAILEIDHVSHDTLKPPTACIGAVHILRNAKIAIFWPPSPYVTNDNTQADPP